LHDLAEAQRAQSAFERYRRMHLPRNQPSAVKPCDAHIGRFCYWHTPDDFIPDEPHDIAAARERLLRTLDALSERSRGDDWISGQRVRYLIEAGYDSSALIASRECWSAAWWCGVLRGFALHAAQRYAESETVFDSALAKMPAAERCRWTDISLLLTDTDRDRYAKLSCGTPERDAFEQRFWQLADPSYVIPGNDRRTEHFSRVLLATLSATSQNTYGLPWGDDLRELLIRYGTPLTYSTTWPTWPAMDAPLIGHEREPSYHFAALDAVSDVAHWDVRADQARERYAPVYMDSLVDLAAQFGMFRRGDSAIIVAIYPNTPRDGSPNTRETLGITDQQSQHTESDTPTVAHALPTAHIRMIHAPWKGVVVGVEQYDPTKRWARRARRWLAPPSAPAGAPGLSTLLLYDGADTSAVTSLNDALQRAITTDDIPTSRKIGIYWETYKTSSPANTPDTINTTTTDSLNDTTTAVAITLTRTDGNFFTRLTQALHLSPRTSPLIITWHDIPATASLAYRSVVLDLHDLPSGTYHLELAAGPDDMHRTVTTRDIQLH
jgi:hypothetical protein